MNPDPIPTPTIAPPAARPKAPHEAPLPGAWDCHAHLFGPACRFPYAEGRGYTPHDCPLEAYLDMLDGIGIERALVVQGNAHGYDNAVLLDALRRAPERLRAVAITDERASFADLGEWDRLGMRGLRFHLREPGREEGYVRGVGLPVLAHFLPRLRELGWAIQLLCDWKILADLEPMIHMWSRHNPVVIDHMLHLGRGPHATVDNPQFQTLLRLVGEGIVYVKLSGPYHMSRDFPAYEDARPLHQALVAANPERLVWGTDWPHPQAAPGMMPDDGTLLDLFHEWTPDPRHREFILVETPMKLFGR